jgi:hypothetical protein
LDRESAGGSITGKGQLFAAEFGVQIAAGQLKERVSGIFFREGSHHGQGFFILKIVTM